jgi:8-oxo-dGTP pyrophosphatase MutT (NUDIX family)
MDPTEIARTLVSLGCPPEKSAEMAAQVDKRARQLAAQKSRTYDEALAHLLGLMAQGWAASGHATSAPPLTSVQPWPKLSSKPVGDFRIFTLRSDLKVNPRTGAEHDFYVIDCVDWVSVIALTPDQQLVMVEQYRHGSDTIELEIPGGMMNPEEKDPIAAGLRELREETGYEGVNARVIGRIFPNAAIMSNRCYTVLVEQCVARHETELDHGEDLVTRLVPAAEIPGLVASGRIQHAMAAVALYHFDLWQRGQ